MPNKVYLLAWDQVPGVHFLLLSRVVPIQKKRYGVSGNSFVAAVEFGKRLKAKTIMTGGELFDPLSKHYTDQAQGFLEGKFKEINFYKEDVLKNTERTYHPGE